MKVQYLDLAFSNYNAICVAKIEIRVHQCWTEGNKEMLTGLQKWLWLIDDYAVFDDGWLVHVIQKPSCRTFNYVDILNVNFFFFSNSLGVEAFMRLCVICGISLSCLCLFLGIYRWTDEDVVMLRNTALARHGHQTSCLILQRDSQISGCSSI